MPTKLTLRIDDELVSKAKAYSKETGKSVSKLVADYLAALPDGATLEAARLAPISRSLRGMMRDAKVEIRDHRRHLEEKYR